MFHGVLVGFVAILGCFMVLLVFFNGVFNGAVATKTLVLGPYYSVLCFSDVLATKTTDNKMLNQIRSNHLCLPFA